MKQGSLPLRGSPFLPLIVAGLLLPAGCDNAPPPAKTPATTVSKGDAGHEHHHSHAEKGPHGGTLVALGDEMAHLEITLDSESGRVTAYVLDGEAQKPVKIKMAKLELEFVRGGHHHDKAGEGKAANNKDKDDDDEVTGKVVLMAVDPADDGTATAFAGEAEELKGADEFEAVIALIQIDIQKFPRVKFNFPEGNEHHHH